MKIKLEPWAFMPTRAHEDDAGLDLYATEDVTVLPYGSVTIDTGVHIELPYIECQYYQSDVRDGRLQMMNTVGFLKSKSGLNTKHGITSDGTIDVGYTGSIRVTLHNHSVRPYDIKRGDKISQLVIVPILTPELEVVDELEETERGDNGFGSTGR